MKALRVHGWGEAPRLEDLPVPARGAGRALVRIKAASLGHIDHTIWGGRFALRPPLPYVPGTEASGVVIESERLPAGRRVWLRGAGLGTRGDGTWREVADVPEAALGELPDEVPHELGAAFFSPCTAGWSALHELGAWRAGERVLVTGAGGAVGSIVVQLAREAGTTVHAVVTPGSRPLAPDVPAVRIGDLQPEADILIDTVGGAVLPQALRGVAPGGRAVLVGYTAGREPPLDLAELMLRDVSLLTLNMVRREAAARARAPELLARLADGRLRLAVETCPLEEGPRVLTELQERRGRGRPVLML